MHCIALNKPYGMICQFSASGDKPTLANVVSVPDVYPAGRLDTDSEGLVLLTDDGNLQAQITQPGSRRRGKLWKTYWAQVEGVPGSTALAALRAGVTLKDGVSKPARAELIQPPDIWERNPPIRSRATIPTQWIELQLAEGRNRQVRRMTAAVGHPTLRLVRKAIGPIDLGTLQPGESRALTADEIATLRGARTDARQRAHKR